MGFSRQEYWSGLPCLPPGDLPNPGIKPESLKFPALAGGFFTTSATWEVLAYMEPSQGVSPRRRASYAPVKYGVKVGEEWPSQLRRMPWGRKQAAPPDLSEDPFVSVSDIIQHNFENNHLHQPCYRDILLLPMVESVQVNMIKHLWN